MKLLLVCTTTDFEKHKNNYFKIRQFLIESGHILTRDWLPNVLNNPKNIEEQNQGSQRVYNLTRKALQDAEILLVENTVEGSGNGHLITLALLWNKPVLVLENKAKKRYFKKRFIQGIESDMLEFADYDNKSYKKIITAFLKKYENAKEKHHFHLVLSEVERRYLDWKQFNSQQSRTEIVRKGLRKLMDKDVEYRKYLEEK